MTKISTKCLHSGQHFDKQTGSIIPPLYQTTTYVQHSPGEHSGYEYTRSHNPTRERLETCLADLENAKHALSTSSGMSATMLIMHLLDAGQKIVCGDDCYGGTYRLFTTVFNKIHHFDFIDTTNEEKICQYFKENRPALIWLETPTNPLLKISDIRKISKYAKSANCLVVVDNTFMTPYFQNPLDLGADIVVHSTSKYINGHSDVIGGSIMTNNFKCYEKLWYLQNSIGPCASPFDSWLTIRGLKTFAIRMQRHAENAQQLVKYLVDHPKIEKVIYPGLETHPQYKISKEQTSGDGGMITCYLQGGLEKAKKFLEQVRLFSLAESLGGVESLIEHPATMTHAAIPKEVRESIGLTDGLVRLSVGIEDIEDLKEDLDMALKTL